MGPPQRRLATGLRRRAEARLGSRLRMARLFPSAPAEVGVEPSPFKRDCGDDLGSVHNVRAISIPCSTMFNNVQHWADLSHPNSERFNVIWPLEKVTPERSNLFESHWSNQWLTQTELEVRRREVKAGATKSSSPESSGATAGRNLPSGVR